MMSLSNDPIDELMVLLDPDVILQEMSHHPIILLRDRLERFDGEQSQVVSRLNQLYINLFEHYLHRCSSEMSPSVLSALFDLIRLHVQLNLKMYSALSDYYFDLSLTYLVGDTTIAYLNDEKTMMMSNLNESFLHLFSSIGSEAVHRKTSCSYSICVSRTSVPNFFQLNPSTDRLLRALLVYLNNSFLDHHHHQQAVQSSPAVLRWLVNLTEIHGFVPFFVKTEYPAAILSWLKKKRDEMTHVSIDEWFLVFHLLHYLARHWIGVKALNKLRAIDTVKSWKDQHLTELFPANYNEHDKDILILYYLVYSVLLVPKELKKENIQKLQRVLDFILERTVRAFDSPDLCCGPYNVCEYLHGLVKFIVNDAFLLYIIQREEIFAMFSEKFLLFHRTCFSTDLNTIICSLLYSIFWSISFHVDFTLKLKSNEEFLRCVEQSSKSDSTDEHAVAMKRAAKGILFNLDLIQMDIEPIVENNKQASETTKVMVSYAHKDTTFCKQLVNQLQDRGFSGEIWVDFNRLSPPYDDDWEEIGKAISQCDVILMVVTENYCSSKSCRREVIHADKRNKRMVPIYQGKDYKAEDWFEIRVGSATWVRFGDKKSDDEVYDILLTLIQTSPKSQPTEITRSVSHVSPTTRQTSPVEQWTREQVEDWFREHHLSNDLFNRLQLTSGSQLLTYGRLLVPSSTRMTDEYERLRSQLGKDVFHLDEFARLIDALNRLETSARDDDSSSCCVL